MSFSASFSLECTTKKSENASLEKYEIVAYSSLMQEPSVETDSTSCEKIISLSECKNEKNVTLSFRGVPPCLCILLRWFHEQDNVQGFCNIALNTVFWCDLNQKKTKKIDFIDHNISLTLTMVETTMPVERMRESKERYKKLKKISDEFEDNYSDWLESKVDLYDARIPPLQSIPPPLRTMRISTAPLWSRENLIRLCSFTKNGQPTTTEIFSSSSWRCGGRDDVPGWAPLHLG